MRADTEALPSNGLRVWYLSRLAPTLIRPPRIHLRKSHAPRPQHDATRRDVVCVPLGGGVTSSENVLLQTASDGKEGCIVMEGGAGSGFVTPSQISAEDLTGAYALLANIGSLSLTLSG